MDETVFQSMTNAEVARLVRGAGVKTVVFPINGTRRWYGLEYPERNSPDAYLQTTWRRHVEVYRLLFDHGLDTLLTPIFGPDLLERGGEYRRLIEPGLLWLATNEEMLAFYDACDIRVRVYGDARRCFRGAPFAHVLEAYEEVARRTASHRARRLFFGVCAHDSAETVAGIGARHFQEKGRLPGKDEIVEAYYGERIEPVSFFIGFDRPAAFDMPLIATGREDLYFTVSPSLYLDAQTLRRILYDHLYSRRVSEAYAELSPGGWQTMSDFYQLNRRNVLGVGRSDAEGCIWYPLPQVELPPETAA